MGAPFVVFRVKRAVPARAENAATGGDPILGEFGHVAKGLADPLVSGLTFKFPNSGTANVAAFAGNKKALVNC
jgi:hypothetical protein